MKLLPFDGVLEKFTPFWQIFHELVHRRAMSEMEKLSHLASALQGDAKQLLAGQQLSGDNYEDLIEGMKRKYGQKRLLLNSLLRTLFKKPQATQMTEARRMVDFLWGSLRQFQTEGLGFTDIDSNFVLLSIYCSKVPEPLLQKWESYVTARETEENLVRGPLPAAQASAPLARWATVEEFLRFCEAKLVALESAAHLSQTARGSHQATRQDKKTPGQGHGNQAGAAASANVASGGGDKTGKGRRNRRNQDSSNGLAATSGDEVAHCNVGKSGGAPAPTAAPGEDGLVHYSTGCTFCGGGHPPGDCRKAGALPVEDRWTLIRVRQNRHGADICFQCLGEDHRSPECPGPLCGQSGCDKRHHRLLHRSSNGNRRA